MTDAISRLAREKHSLVHIGCCGATSEVTRKRAVTHQYDIIRVRFFFRARSTLLDVAAVIVHADDRALVKRSVDNIFIAIITHKCYRTGPMFSPPNLLAKENRGLLLDIVVFVLNIVLMRWLTGYFLQLVHLANGDERLAQFTLTGMCLSMWILPAAGAVMRRWHFHQRLKEEGKKVDWEEGAAGCLFNPIFYFCLNIVLMSAIIAGLGTFLFGNKVSDNGAIFVPLIFFGLFCTIAQTYLIYRYFSVPQEPPRSAFLRHPESELLLDI